MDQNDIFKALCAAYTEELEIEPYAAERDIMFRLAVYLGGEELSATSLLFWADVCQQAAIKLAE